MPLVDMRALLGDALRRKFAVGYFEAWNLESLRAVAEAAEEENSPVILGFGGVYAEGGKPAHRGVGIETLAAMGLSIARGARVPVSLIFNEASDFEQAASAIRHGFNSVMLDSVGLPFEENIRTTRRLVEAAHDAGVSVEAELGVLPMGTEGVMGGVLEPEQPSLTDPRQAGIFVDRTGIDALAVSIGNVHVLAGGEAEIDLERLRRIHERVSLPLVIHGGSGFPGTRVGDAIEGGVAKFNVGTVLKKAFWHGLWGGRNESSNEIEAYLAMGRGSARDILALGMAAVKEEVRRRMNAYRSSGKAGLRRVKG